VAGMKNPNDKSQTLKKYFINHIFCRYRHEFKSQDLWTEIKFVLENFATAFTQLFSVSGFFD